ncbi:NAD(P)H-binding protein [Loktanella sp. SALINAS62]|uniref:NAD(P)-dependent oxidoreductase n=1 Tax=Loktanella sp. SALINAS62 TaxID=2706124 RepID=UPI001B8AA6AA|nr:NAD(P)H-binding protein [Loktanella sp. SALINAS62]MBS1303023.1 NAD(P)H-binding protein [Loktanella sp. SALINAS62]
MKLAVLGAKGAVGQHLVDQALGRGHTIMAIELDCSDMTPRDGLSCVDGDVLGDDLSPHFAGCDAVLSCLGVGNAPRTLLDPPPLYTRGTSNILTGMHGAGVDRLIVISASFVAAKDRGPIHFRVPVMAALHNVLDQMAEMEAQLRGSAVNWTAVRPGWLMQGDLTADYVVTPDVIPEDMIRTRMADVAHFMLELAESGGWPRQTPALARVEALETTSIAAVMREMTG